MSDQKQKIRKKRMISIIAFLSGVYFFMRFGCKKYAESEKINEENPYIDFNHIKIRSGQDNRIPTVYERKIKPAIDRILSFVALIVLSPLFGLISIIIYIDDPGPVFFTQKRVGKGKAFFNLHKFRSMKMSTPHDVPTHQLEHPEQYITKVGRVLRKTSLDELPQIWDIFRGKMSIIGPRPALWNQEDLIAERERYGANDIVPGLTGWAQINGRDELEISEKARLDGEYTLRLRKGGWKAFFMDIRCFWGTLYNAFAGDGVIEGGTGMLHRESAVEFAGGDTMPVRSKRILIMGSGSYIGGAVKTYLESDSPLYIVEEKDTIGLVPEPGMFKGYDVVFHVAGIAHMKETAENRPAYFKINRDLTVDIAKAAKAAGVGQFITLSSMSVYGILMGRIDRATVPRPVTAYGASKLSADETLKRLADADFKVAVLRPPMVYGKGCRGNYQLLRNFAVKSFVFPDIRNQRSMIYIGNLCEFVKRVIDCESSGLFFPQNREYVSTTEMVSLIAQSNGKKIKTTRIFNPLLRVIPLTILKKIFGDLTYEKVHTVGKYRFQESIRLTEKKTANKDANNMNLWIFHHYATTPDRNGYIRPFRFAKHLEKEGIRSVIFASSYHHWSDENVINDKALFQSEYADCVPFVFVRTPSSAAGTRARIKNMAAFSAKLSKVGPKVRKTFGKPDVILASSPHPFTMIAGILEAKRYQVPCICEIRDLWPEAIFAGGRLKEKSVAGRILTAGEHWIYRHADALIFTKEGDTDYLYEKGWMTSQGGDINPAKCFYINNGVELSLFDEQKKTEIPDDKDLEDNAFKVVYAGAIRPVNDVENIVNAARLLPADSNIKILIYGDGNLRKTLERKAETEGISKVVFKGYVDQKYIPYILSKSSVNLLNYSSTNYTWKRGNSSNKLFEYLASGKPVIATIKTGYSIIERYDCGLEMEEESPEELARDIMTVKKMSAERYEELCANARNAAYDFDYSKLSEKLLNVLNWVKQ